MPLSMYEISVPAFTRMLRQLPLMLDKGIAHARARGEDPAALLALRLHPKMWNLGQQIKVSANFPVEASARLAGLPLPGFEVDAANLEMLRQHLPLALAFVERISPSAFDGSEARQVEYDRGDDVHRASGKDYLLHFVLPNLYFHAGMAYAILRQHGVPLVKEDFGRGFSF